MGDVVQMKAKDERDLILVCDCGCTTHYHHANQDVECGSCGYVFLASDDGWRERLSPAPAEAETVPDGAFKTTEIGAEFAFRKFVKEADLSKVAIITIINDDGTLSVWTGKTASGAEQVAWVKRRFAEATERALRSPLAPSSRN